MWVRILLTGILVAALALVTLDARAEGGAGQATTSCPPCQSIVDAINEKRNEIEIVEHRLAHDTRQENRLVEQARPIRREINAIKPLKEQIAQEIAALQPQLRNARWRDSQLSWLQALAQGVTSELAYLENLMLSLQENLGRLQARLDVLEPQLDQIEHDLVRVRREIDESEDDLERLRPELQGLERALATCEEQCKPKTGGGGGGTGTGITVGVPGGETSQPEGEGTEGDDGAPGDASTTCVPCTALTDTINELIAELRELKKALKEAEAEAKRLGNEVTSRRDEIYSARRQIDELKRQQVSQQENVEHLDTMFWKYGSGGVLDNFGSRLEAAEEALEQTQADIAAAEASIERLEQEIAELEEPWREAVRKRQELAGQVQDKQAAIDGLFRMLSECENQCRVSTTPKQHIKVGDEYGAADVFSPEGDDRKYRVLPPGVWLPGPDAADPGQDAAIAVGEMLDAVNGMQPQQSEDAHVAPEPEQPKTVNPCNDD